MNYHKLYYFVINGIINIFNFKQKDGLFMVKKYIQNKTLFVFKKNNKNFFLFTYENVSPCEAIPVITECLETKQDKSWCYRERKDKKIDSLEDIRDRVSNYSYFGRWASGYHFLLEKQDGSEHITFDISKKDQKKKSSEIINEDHYNYCYYIDMNYKKIIFHGNGNLMPLAQMAESTMGPPSGLEGKGLIMSSFCDDYYYQAPNIINEMILANDLRVSIYEAKAASNLVKAAKRKAKIALSKSIQKNT